MLKGSRVNLAVTEVNRAVRESLDCGVLSGGICSFQHGEVLEMEASKGNSRPRRGC